MLLRSLHSDHRATGRFEATVKGGYVLEIATHHAGNGCTITYAPDKAAHAVLDKAPVK